MATFTLPTSARVFKALNQKWILGNGSTRTTREFIEQAESLIKRIQNGWDTHYDRQKFNRMNGDEAKAYEVKLNAMRVYSLRNEKDEIITVSREVFDLVAGEAIPVGYLARDIEKGKTTI